MRVLKNNWEQTREKFDRWWAFKPLESPIVQMICGSDKPREFQAVDIKNDAERFTKLPDSIVCCENSLQCTEFLYDAIPHYYANLGPGSFGVFLGARPEFNGNTVWYHKLYDDLENIELSLENGKKWLDFSINATKTAKEKSGGKYLTAIPDLIEGLDTIAALIGTQELMYALVDCPDEIHNLQRQLLSLWQRAYDLHYDIVKDESDYSLYAAFAVWGKGKTAKLQCDVSAMMSADMFEGFALPYLIKQCEGLDNIIYHLDGVNAVKHLDMILKIDKISCVQWTPGDGQPEGGDECWDFIYKKILNSGKNIYGYMSGKSGVEFLKRYGPSGILLNTWADNEKQACDMFSGFVK